MRPLHYDRDGNPLSFEQYIALIQESDRKGENYKRVAETTVEDRFWVSTVWLGLDHSYTESGPPVIFETMAFPVGPDDGPAMRDPLDDFTQRYATEEQAREGHLGVVLMLRYEIEHGSLRGLGPEEGQGSL